MTHSFARWALATTGLAALLSATAILRAEPVYDNLQPLGFVQEPNGKLIQQVGVDGTTAVCIQEGGTVVIYDLARPLEQARRGQITTGIYNTLPSSRVDVAVDLPRAAVAGGVSYSFNGTVYDYRLVTLDLTNLDAPKTITSEDLENALGPPGAVQIDGDRLFFLSRTQALRVVEFPFTSIVTEGTVVPTTRGFGMELEDGRLYIHGPHLRILDIPEDATQATLTGLTMPAQALLDISPIVVADGKLLCAVRDELAVFDVSVPASPVEVGRFTTQSTITGISQMTPNLVVVTAATGLQVVDISDPQQMAVRGSWLEPSDPLVREAALAFPNGEIFVFTKRGVSKFQYLGALTESKSTAIAEVDAQATAPQPATTVSDLSEER